MLTGDDIRRTFRQHMGEAASFLDAFDPMLRELNVARMPATGETAAIAFHNPKTAALCFDRIWSGFKPDIPASVGFRGISAVETILTFLTALLLTLDQSKERNPELQHFAQKVGETLLSILPEAERTMSPGIDQYSKAIAEGIGSEHGIPVVAVYASETQRDLEYQPGNRSAVIAVLENVPVVNEASLEWDQVIDFRRDKANLAKFRKFMHWLDKDMVGKQVTFIKDDVAVKLHDYHEATKTHGLATVTGILQLTLDSSMVAGGTAFLAKLLATVDTPDALWSGLGAAAARIALHVASTLINVRSQRTNAAGEIAYVVEMSRKLGAG